VLGAALGLAAPSSAEQSGLTGSGAAWALSMPQHWNGTLLIYSHGYSAALRAPDLAPRGTEDWLLAHGYALIASAYSSPGWAVAEAVPDQMAALDAFALQYGRPQRVIAWGSSMGGLITIALAEQYPGRIAAALPSCGSIAGSLGMMNQALDGAFAVKWLLAGDADIQLVRIDDDRANAQRVEALVERASRSAAGRARLALAAAVSQWPMPDEADRGFAGVSPRDFAAGVFLPRHDQEQRAGGVFSWNSGVDYRRQLHRSGQAMRVRDLYRAANLSLSADLGTLNSAPRIAADPAAVSYMRLHYVPTGELTIPVLSYQTLGDPLTVASQQMSYASAVRGAERANLALGWVQRAGHCEFSAAEHIAALQSIEARLRDGRWQSSPERLNSLAAATGLGDARFTAQHAANFLRPCGRAHCPGEPVGAPAQ